MTLLRSPLSLQKHTAATVQSLGLSSRLSSVVVPITRHSSGQILKIKELVAVKSVNGVESLGKTATREWRDRAGEGRQGSGLRSRTGTEGSGMASVRVGSERNRGEERGYKVVRRAQA